MRKDPTEFRKRFAAWKDGKQPYKDGKVVLNNYTNAEFNDDGTFTDDTTRVFDDFYVTPSGVKTKYGSYTDKNWDRYKQQEQFFKTHDQQTGKIKYEPGLEQVSPEFDILPIARLGRLTKPIAKETALAIKNYRYPLSRTAPKITAENAANITRAQWTAAQDAAIARGDISEAQRLRDLHFKINTPGNVVIKEGAPTHNYHGTDREFNTFDIRFFGRTDYGDRGKGFYFSENRNVSKDYGPIVKDVYLYAKTPYKGFGKEKYLGRGRSKDEVVQYLTEQHRKSLENSVKHMINQQKSGSHSPMYDELGITKDMSEQEIRNLVNKAYNHEDVIPYEVGNLDEADVFLSPYENVVFKPNQIKSANAVTYDNKGVRIPLGERDNFKLTDVRYSLLPFLGIGAGYGAYNKYAK